MPASTQPLQENSYFKDRRFYSVPPPSTTTDEPSASQVGATSTALEMASSRKLCISKQSLSTIGEVFVTDAERDCELAGSHVMCIVSLGEAHIHVICPEFEFHSMGWEFVFKANSNNTL